MGFFCIQLKHQKHQMVYAKWRVFEGTNATGSIIIKKKLHKKHLTSCVFFFSTFFYSMYIYTDTKHFPLKQKT